MPLKKSDQNMSFWAQRRIRGGPRRPPGETRCFARAQHDTRGGLFHGIAIEKKRPERVML